MDKQTERRLRDEIEKIEEAAKQDSCLYTEESYEDLKTARDNLVKFVDSLL